MNPVIVEDRTKETARERASRHARMIGAVVTQTASTLCEGEVATTLHALTSALALAAEQTGASHADLIALLRQERKLAQIALEEQAKIFAKSADA